MLSCTVGKKQYPPSALHETGWGHDIAEIGYHQLLDTETNRYGVAISLQRSGKEDEFEYEIVNDITSDKLLIERILRILIHNEVAPSGLNDALEGLLIL
jgi:hypothetical protein